MVQNFPYKEQSIKLYSLGGHVDEHTLVTMLGYPEPLKVSNLCLCLSRDFVDKFVLLDRNIGVEFSGHYFSTKAALGSTWTGSRLDH